MENKSEEDEERNIKTGWRRGIGEVEEIGSRDISSVILIFEILWNTFQHFIFFVEPSQRSSALMFSLCFSLFYSSCLSFCCAFSSTSLSSSLYSSLSTSLSSLQSSSRTPSLCASISLLFFSPSPTTLFPSSPSRHLSLASPAVFSLSSCLTISSTSRELYSTSPTLSSILICIFSHSPRLLYNFPTPILRSSLSALFLFPLFSSAPSKHRRTFWNIKITVLKEYKNFLNIRNQKCN